MKCGAVFYGKNKPKLMNSELLGVSRSHFLAEVIVSQSH
jgi:hypothetical protein